MSLTVGFSEPGKITIGGKSLSTIQALKKADEEAAAQARGEEKPETNEVRTGGGVAAGAKAEGSGESDGNTQSLTVKMLLKRLQELREQLQQQQQQLAAAQAATYPSEEAKTTAVMSIQGQIAQTNGAIAVTSANLVKELSKGSGSGGVVNTTA